MYSMLASSIKCKYIKCDAEWSILACLINPEVLTFHAFLHGHSNLGQIKFL